MSISLHIQEKVYSFLKEKITQKIETYHLNPDDAAKPFQYALFSKSDYLTKGFIHGCETGLGSWHESLARIIAGEKFKVAKKLQGASKLKGAITPMAQEACTLIISDLDSARREPNHVKEAEEIYKKSLSGESELLRTQTVDLYLERDNGEEIFFEIKGPKPNKNEMRAAKRDLLEIYAMRARKGKRVNVYLGMYYNPYAPAPYERWTCTKFFDQGNDFLVGKNFWDFLGGKGTYEDLITIYKGVGKEIRPLLTEKLKSL